MRLSKCFLCIAAAGFLLTACTFREVELGPKNEISSYKEDILKISNPLELDMKVEVGDIEVYSWDRNEIKLESTKKIRGNLEKEVLRKKLEDFEIEIKTDKNTASYESKYSGQKNKHVEESVDLRVFIPKKISVLSLKLGSGRVKLLDDINCDLGFDVNTADIEINRLVGRAQINGRMGSVSIYGGKIMNNSSITEDIGNINITAVLEHAGNYTFETNVGNIDLFFPSDSQASFEILGTLEVNEITPSSGAAHVKAKSGMGKIAVKKYFNHL